MDINDAPQLDGTNLALGLLAGVRSPSSGAVWPFIHTAALAR